MLTPTSIEQVEGTQQEEKVYRTYKLDLENKRIIGYVDSYEAVVQNVLKTILTERYAYEIYTSDIGMEMEKYIGEDFDYIKANFKKELLDALKIDDRVKGIEDIEITKTDIDTVTINVIINSNEGNINLNLEVNI